ncbi:MAG: hypothetical protein AAF226_14835, partial [Verrucomicrobiota bacterium]
MNKKEHHPIIAFLKTEARNLTELFGGSWLVGCLVVIFVAAVLITSALRFIPAHNRQLELARMTGIEYFTEVEEAHQTYAEAVKLLKIIYDAEFDHYSITGTDQAVQMAKDKTTRLLSLYSRAKVGSDDLNEIRKVAFEHSIDANDRAERTTTLSERYQEATDKALATEDAETRAQHLRAMYRAVAMAEYFNAYGKAFYLYQLTELLKTIQPDEKAYLNLPSPTRKKAEVFLNRARQTNPNFFIALDESRDIYDSLPLVDESILSKEGADILKQLSDLVPLSDDQIF